MRHRIARYVVGALLVWGVPGVALATITSGNFVPASAQDAQFIRNRGEGVWNTDPSAPRFVTASLNVITAAPEVRRYTVYGFNNGGAQECVVNVTNVATGATTRATGTTSVRGTFNYAITVPAPGPGVFAYNLICRLPPLIATSGSFIYGVQF